MLPELLSGPIFQATEDSETDTSLKKISDKETETTNLRKIQEGP
jgi:hypothetical protein